MKDNSQLDKDTNTELECDIEFDGDEDYNIDNLCQKDINEIIGEPKPAMKNTNQLTITEKREIIARNFHKLKEKYLNQEQKKLVYLGESEEDYWQEHKNRKGGTTYPRRREGKLVVIWAFVRLQHPNPEEVFRLKKLLKIIAHEFAHSWLILKYPNELEKTRCVNNSEHDYWGEQFSKYLMDNLEPEEKEIIAKQKSVK